MQYMINKKETKVQNKVLNKIERDRYKGSTMLLLFSVQLLAYLITSSFMTKLCSNLDTSSECCLWSTSAAYNLLTKTQKLSTDTLSYITFTKFNCLAKLRF